MSDAVLMSLVEREGAEEVRRDELSRLIFQGGVRTVFHPIVRLADRTVIGHEALTRPQGDVSFHSVEDLFAPIPHGDGQTVLREALLVADHNAYHLGQLVVVRRLLGCWPEEG